MKRILAIILMIPICVIFYVDMKLAYNDTMIKQTFSQRLSKYPIKNLESFYDMEGPRNANFDKDDKGKWVVLNTQIFSNRYEKVRIELNRNTRTASGKYIIHHTLKSKYGNPINKKESYPIKMKNNQLYYAGNEKDIQKHPEIEKKIKEFKFFCQYGRFDHFEKYRKINFHIRRHPLMYYILSYKVPEDDFNVNELRKHYQLPQSEPTRLMITGDDNFIYHTVGADSLSYRFDDKKVSIEDGIHFVPTR
ncbi:Csa1 family protein [Staphylococcus pettenkoferi]|nr:Csa1 family protein [Staphylococcus pettenkoferi]MCY1568965.1 tandem-type lipoprotein [Staphylococcus pettenkoferi]MCY1576862.1 tandem-type lipoprotein [Staphylococcus pettenkoferi]MCY1618925.1 tandem-type lipoprotein [Staphylococcus pettenkoferi]